MFLLRTLTTVFINNIASSSNSNKSMQSFDLTETYAHGMNNNLERKKQVRCKLYYKRIHKENNAN